MVTVVVTTEAPIDAAGIGADLSNCGFDVILCEEASDAMVQSAIRLAPELVVAVSASPSDFLLESAALINKVAPCAFVLFTSDASPARIDRAAQAGVHSYVIDGYAPRRLRSVVQVALARFRQEQVRGEKLQSLTRDLRDRKQVERAKGLLMRSRGLNEEAAFELMRSLAMRRRLRLAAVAEAVIALSIGAEAVNRAGQLRMLAQRVARCFIQLRYDVHAEWAQANLRECQERIDSNIAILRRTIADRGCATDIERIATVWSQLREALAAPPATTDRLAAVDALAELLTEHAETLTAFLETSGLVTNLRVINLAGRQRMLGQRVGKLCLMLALDDGCPPVVMASRAAQLQQAVTEFTRAQAELTRMPIHTPEIDRWLAEAQTQWAEMQPFQRGEGAMPRCIEVTERLLDVMEALTEAYEQAAQVLIGDRIDTFEASGDAAGT
jgi:AmiR/NasT family two-component response regulator